MNSTIVTLLKNVVLIALLFLSVGNYFYSWFSFKDLLSIQLLVGLIYVFLSCYELVKAMTKSQLPVKSFPYITNKYITFKVAKIGIFLSLGVMIFITNSLVKYLYPVCFIIAITETIVLILRYTKKYGFISIYANYLLFCEDKIIKLFANQIRLVEYRHEIFYFIKTNNKSIQINLTYIEKKRELINSLTEWVERNKLKVSAEGLDNLKKSRGLISN